MRLKDDTCNHDFYATERQIHSPLKCKLCDKEISFENWLMWRDYNTIKMHNNLLSLTVEIQKDTISKLENELFYRGSIIHNFKKGV